MNRKVMIMGLTVLVVVGVIIVVMKPQKISGPSTAPTEIKTSFTEQISLEINPVDETFLHYQVGDVAKFKLHLTGGEYPYLVTIQSPDAERLEFYVAENGNVNEKSRVGETWQAFPRSPERGTTMLTKALFSQIESDDGPIRVKAEDSKGRSGETRSLSILVKR